jgi:hypothetical protein
MRFGETSRCPGRPTALGVAAVIRASAPAFDALRVAGAVYVALLGLRSLGRAAATGIGRAARAGLTASRVAISAGLIGVALWVVQLAVGLPSWLWWARLVFFAIAAVAFLDTWAAGRLVIRRGQGA